MFTMYKLTVSLRSKYATIFKTVINFNINIYISILGYNFLDLLYVIIKVRVLRVADLYGRKLYILLKKVFNTLKNSYTNKTLRITSFNNRTLRQVNLLLLNLKL